MNSINIFYVQLGALMENNSVIIICSDKSLQNKRLTSNFSFTDDLTRIVQVPFVFTENQTDFCKSSCFYTQSDRDNQSINALLLRKVVKTLWKPQSIDKKYSSWVSEKSECWNDTRIIYNERVIFSWLFSQLNAVQDVKKLLSLFSRS